MRSNDEIYNLGPLNGYVSNQRGIELISLHRELFYWIVFAIALHISAVVYHGVARGENPVRAVFTGRKPASAVPAEKTIESSRIVAALMIVAVLAGLLAWVARHAPVSQAFSGFNSAASIRTAPSP
jgi:hypothetical protein